jgi:hypothetical protein
VDTVHALKRPNNIVCSYANGPIQWRLPIAFQAFFAIFLVLQMLPLPETPRFLIEKNRNLEAAKVLARLKSSTTTIDDPEIAAIRKQIEDSIALESAGGPFKYKELLGCGRLGNFRRICLCMAVNVMQQFTGSNMINYYAPVGQFTSFVSESMRVVWDVFLT